MKYIEDIALGQSIRHQVLITPELHQGFVELSGDDSPIHTDAEFCQGTKFGRPIGHAFLLTTILSKIYGTIFPGGSELCLSQTCLFKNPFYVGDTLTYTLEVVQRNEQFQLITIKTTVSNQAQQPIFQGEAKMRLCLGKDELI